ncbi:MAG: trigger factor [Lachnospiraceae bacterium]|jgi:trigger factor|nr:trigger factor [Lachnospiraceae bacterium]HBV82189.1 trigger factor [Lachnospiraceae bacterium]
MKKKVVLMCLTGMMIMSISACGEKKTDKDANVVETSSVMEENETTTVVEEESSDSTQTEIDRVSDREDYVGFQDLDIDKYVTLGDYKKMKVTAARPKVNEEAIENYINTRLLVGTITNRPVKEGDVVDIDYVGKKDGVAFDGGTASGYKLSIGSGGFIPGFEDGLIGVETGETVDLNLTFPDNYRNATMAGEEVVFTVTVNGIEGAAEYATVTPKEMAEMGLSYKTKEEVWEAGKRAMEENAEETYAANAKSAVVRKVVEESTIESVPEYLIEEEAQNYNHYIESLAKSMYNMDLETFVTNAYGVTMEQYNLEMNEMFTDTVRQYLVMEAIARAEKMEITEEMIAKKADEEATEYGYASGDALIADVGFATYRMSIVQNMVIERLMEVVTVEEEEA